MLSSSQGTTNKVAYTLPQVKVSSGAATNGGTSVSGYLGSSSQCEWWKALGSQFPQLRIQWSLILFAAPEIPEVEGWLTLGLSYSAYIFQPKYPSLGQKQSRMIKCYKYRHDFSSQDSQRSQVYEKPQSTGSMGSTFNWIFYKTPCSFTAWLSKRPRSWAFASSMGQSVFSQMLSYLNERQ